MKITERRKSQEQKENIWMGAGSFSVTYTRAASEPPDLGKSVRKRLSYRQILKVKGIQPVVLRIGKLGALLSSRLFISHSHDPRQVIAE